MVPAGNKASRLSSVNHFAKTIYHHYHHTLKNNIYHSNKRGPPPPFFNSDTNPVLGHVLVHSVDKTHVLVVTVELICLLFLNIVLFQLCSNTEQISQVHEIQKKLCKPRCFRSNHPLSKLRCFSSRCALLKVARFFSFNLFLLSISVA